MGEKIALACEICQSRNYNTEKNSSISDRIEIKKFCKRCNRHTIHRETK
ncbi:50S ribosomal protein L33 [Gracilibacillus kekensis]|uniref:Large ribosomal subunit protein bL33 n=1 Tax=Gracilibacillus kekensis TaxID=1027249 RepID=A0A1M7QYH1_9BACI|nr:50S ribosomal protein L33 [Gracilibacillus kekensis]SHN37065.1 LSU ribosomal protein L33P [Gracilibacillus kekensis]